MSAVTSSLHESNCNTYVVYNLYIYTYTWLVYTYIIYFDIFHIHYIIICFDVLFLIFYLTTPNITISTTV